MKVNIDCRHYLGEIPCQPHKNNGVHCKGCKYYDPIGEKIIIIKLGAAGDVIRTTPLLRKIKEKMPKSFIVWVSDYTEILPFQVDRKMTIDNSKLLWLKAMHFDILFSLDK